MAVSFSLTMNEEKNESDVVIEVGKDTKKDTEESVTNDLSGESTAEKVETEKKEDESGESASDDEQNGDDGDDKDGTKESSTKEKKNPWPLPQ